MSEEIDLEEEIKKFREKELKKYGELENEDAVFQYVIEKAYNDMQPRTITGHGKIPNLKSEACEKVKSLFEEKVCGKQVPSDQATFDDIHKKICIGFLRAYNDRLSDNKQKYGKAQKIVNMTFKYLFCLNKIAPLAIDENWFEFCHMPLDSYTLNWYKETIDKKSKFTWSNLDDKKYYEIRGKIEQMKEKGGMLKKYKVDNELKAEFIIWQEEKNKRVLKELESAMKKCMKENLKEEMDKKIQEVIEKNYK